MSQTTTPRASTSPTVRRDENRGRRMSTTASKINTSLPSPGSPEFKSFGGGRPIAEILDAVEKEQEAMVNRLQREIHTLKAAERSRSRSQSTSSSSSVAVVTRTTSTRSLRSDVDDSSMGNNSQTKSARGSFSGEADAYVVSLRRENEMLRRKLADLSIKLTEKENEIDHLKSSRK